MVDEDGNITGCKPGNAVITVKADGYSVNCKVTVRQLLLNLTGVTNVFTDASALN